MFIDLFLQQTNITQTRRSSGANFINSVKTPPTKNASNLSLSEKGNNFFISKSKFGKC